MHFFFSVGEPSGDHHAAHLMQELSRRVADCRFTGFGGELMRAAGQEQLSPLADNPVMGIGAVLPEIFKYIRLIREAGRVLEATRPEAVILVDAPAFNWWIARAAKRLQIPVIYYMPPQLWAWAPWRIRKMRRTVDHVLTGLPFEAEWYSARGMSVECVGHPFLEEVANQRAAADVESTSIKGANIDRDNINSPSKQRERVVGILPGSRRQEVRSNFPVMLDVINRLSQQHPDVRFEVACYREVHREMCLEAMQRFELPLPVTLHVGQTPEIIERADCCLMVSGSVSLELLARETPAVVMYRAGIVMSNMARFLVTCKWISLPNLVAGRELMPEVPFCFFPNYNAGKITKLLNHWLENPALLAAARADLKETRQGLGDGRAIANAATAVLRQLGVVKSTETSTQRAA